MGATHLRPDPEVAPGKGGSIMSTLVIGGMVVAGLAFLMGRDRIYPDQLEHEQKFHNIKKELEKEKDRILLQQFF
jgi:hypothetical protein